MENHDKGVAAISKYAGPAKDLFLKKINSCPKAFSDNMFETYGRNLHTLQNQFTAKEIAVAAFCYRIGANIELTPGVVGLLAAGYTRKDIENLMTGVTVLCGYAKTLNVWPEINAAIEVYESLGKIRKVS